MMMRIASALLTSAIVLAACGTDSAAPAKPRVGSGAGACGGREGATYISRLTERSGNCGFSGLELVVQGQTVSNEADAGADACGGKVSVSEDGCEITFDTDCPSRGQAGWRIREQGKSRWSTDGSYGTAVESIVLIDENGNTACAATVDAELTRQ